ncbi:MAG: cytochrome P460 family protein [Acidobacteria bacterium]|nr:cytochrome P460 family protein [Acidobacteriota bacterium]
MPDNRVAPRREKKKPENPHEKGAETFARVFVDELAAGEIGKASPSFPAGATIVREKLLRADDAQPALVTVMIKREKGFSPKTGDWEYAVVDGPLDRIVKRETTGSCSKCHAQAAATDFVFKTYLK